MLGGDIGGATAPAATNCHHGPKMLGGVLGGAMNECVGQVGPKMLGALELGREAVG